MERTCGGNGMSSKSLISFAMVVEKLFHHSLSGRMVWITLALG